MLLPQGCQSPTTCAETKSWSFCTGTGQVRAILVDPEISEACWHGCRSGQPQNFKLSVGAGLASETACRSDAARRPLSCVMALEECTDVFACF